jgi:hypothetical protein
LAYRARAVEFRGQAVVGKRVGTAVEESGFEDADAPQVPLGVHDLTEERELEHTDGLEVGFEGGEHGVELRAFVVADDQFAAAQPMCASVL